MPCRTRSRVCRLTRSGRVSTREIVATETPSSAATDLLEGECGFFKACFFLPGPGPLEVERQPQARARPASLVQSAGAGARDPRIAHVGAPEADVGGYGIGSPKMLVGALRL